MAPQGTKKPCSNNEKYKYTGKELSPLGIGLASEAENIGKQMIGRDGKNWIVVSKNNNKVWMRAPEPNLAKEHPILSKSSGDEDNYITSSAYDKGGPSGNVHGDTDKSDVSSSDEEEEETKPHIPKLNVNIVESDDDDEETTPRPTDSPHSIAGSPKDMREKPKHMSVYLSKISHEKKPTSSAIDMIDTESDDESQDEEAPKSKSNAKEEVSESEEEEEAPKSKSKPKPKAKEKAAPKPKSKSKPKEVSESEEEEEAPKPKSKTKTKDEQKEVTTVSKRKTHAVKASMYDDGYTKVEDGITYIVKESANNVKKWVKQSPPKSNGVSTGKKRGPTAYNLFIGKQLTELRKTVPGLKTTEYMQLALQTWNNMTPEEKADIKK